ncbi:hypothetical protein QUF63_06540 [Anaerolineales bacterium HSG25]|nr:hypothetical protein [Anaerolineales bacterium HSG25]
MDTTDKIIGHLQTKKLSRADELRELLSSLESRAPRLKNLTETKMLILLRDLDRVHKLFEALQSTGLDLTAEASRFNSLQLRLQRSTVTIVKQLGGAQVMRDHRPKSADEVDQWWWYIDSAIVDRQKRIVMNIAMVLGIFFAVVIGFYVAFQTVLAPEPSVVARLEVENAVYQTLLYSEYEKALAQVDEGLQNDLLTDDPTLLLLKGTIHDSLNQPEQAEESFNRVKTVINDPVTFYIARAQLYLRNANVDKAEEDIRQVIKLDERKSSAWLMLGQIFETQGKRFDAIRTYEHAGNLATENGDNEVVVMARMALAQMGATTLPADAPLEQE